MDSWCHGITFRSVLGIERLGFALGQRRKVFVALAVRQELAQIEDEVDHDGRKDEKEEGEDNPGPAETPLTGFCRALCSGLLLFLARKVRALKRQGILGIGLVWPWRRVETGSQNRSRSHGEARLFPGVFAV